MDIFMQHDIQELSRVVSVFIEPLTLCVTCIYMYMCTCGCSVGANVDSCSLCCFQLLDNIESKMKGTSVEVCVCVCAHVYGGLNDESCSLRMFGLQNVHTSSGYHCWPV